MSESHGFVTPDCIPVAFERGRGRARVVAAATPLDAARRRGNARRMSAPPESSPAPAPEHKPYVAPEAQIAVLSPRAVVQGAAFGVLFGAVTVYLALKVGLTVSASIPIAVLSIMIFRRLGRSTILENNIVQTIGSARA